MCRLVFKQVYLSKPCIHSEIELDKLNKKRIDTLTELSHITILLADLADKRYHEQEANDADDVLKDIIGEIVREKKFREEILNN